MPRGNPNFGRMVKSPGRPPKVKKALDTKTRVDEFIDEHIDEYLLVLHEDAVKNRNPKSAQVLIERRLGKPAERQEAAEGILAGVLQMLARHRLPPPRITVLEPEEPDRGEADGAAET